MIVIPEHLTMMFVRFVPDKCFIMEHILCDCYSSVCIIR